MRPSRKRSMCLGGRLHGATIWPATLLTLLVSCVVAPAQTENSRADQIEAARDQKAQTAPPALPSNSAPGDRTKSLIGVLGLNPGASGLHLKVGGVVSGAGFAPFGLEYLRRDLAGGELLFRGRVQASTKQYQKYDLQLGLPSVWGDRFFLMAYAVRHDYPGLNYYGPGPDSEKSFRSNYRLEDTGIQGSAGVRPFSHFNMGVSLGYLLINVGPGTDSRFVSADKVFTPMETPGIDRQANFLRQVGFLELDYRDDPKVPHSGGRYAAEYGRYIDKTLGLHDFQRLDLHLQQYIPFFNETRVIALTGRSVMTFTKAGQTVPFYLEPTLGGAEDLRGFRAFRFHDDNLLATTAEYQWRASSFLDMALFADAGKVFPRGSQLNFHDLETSVGFGLRFHVRNTMPTRIDVGFSHEGFQVWVRFNNVFGDRPAGPVIHSDFVDGRGANANRY